MRKLCLVLSLLCCIVARATEPVPAPEAFAEVRTLVSRAVEEGMTPSIGVAVIQNGEVIWLETFGKADLAQGTAATPDTPYPLTSCTKPATALAFLELRERGLIDLDKPANTYLGDNALRAAQGKAEDITARRLLNHTAGFARYFSYYYAPVQPLAKDQVIARYGQAVIAPGESFEYSNLGYAIAGALLEKAADAPWGEFMQKNLLDPLGLAHSAPSAPADAARLYAHDAADRFQVVPPALSDHAAGSGLWMSTADAATLLRLVLGEGTVNGVTLLKPESVKLLFDTPEKSKQAGLGWFVADYLSQKSYSHAGSMPGAMAEFRGFPGDKSGVVVFTNSDGNNLTGQIIWAAAQVLYPGAEEKEPEPQEMPESDLEAFQGDWSATLDHFSGAVALTLLIEDDDTAYLRFAEGPMRRIQSFSLVGDQVSGQLWAEFPARADFQSTVKVGFALRKAGDQLRGIFTTEADALFYLPTYVAFAPLALGEEKPAGDTP